MNPPPSSSEPLFDPHDVGLIAPPAPGDRHSRSSSVNSQSPSVQSAANSTRYMLAGMNNNSSGLDPPTLPYGSRAGSFRSASPSTNTPLMDTKSLSTSLSVNYLPTKFSELGGGTRRRKGGKIGGIAMPKRGGGREAFKANEARMPGEDDDDYDGVDPGKGRKGRLRWNRFKWILFFSNLIVSTCCSPSVSPFPVFLHDGDDRAGVELVARCSLTPPCISGGSRSGRCLVLGAPDALAPHALSASFATFAISLTCADRARGRARIARRWRWPRRGAHRLGDLPFLGGAARKRPLIRTGGLGLSAACVRRVSAFASPGRACFAMARISCQDVRAEISLAVRVRSPGLAASGSLDRFV